MIGLARRGIWDATSGRGPKRRNRGKIEGEMKSKLFFIFFMAGILSGAFAQGSEGAGVEDLIERIVAERLAEMRTQLRNEITAPLDQRIAQMQTQITGLTNRLNAIEQTQLPGLTNRLNAIERTQVPGLTNRLNAVEQTQIPGLTNRLNAIERTQVPGLTARLNAIEQAGIQDIASRLNAIEQTQIAGLASRLSAIEGSGISDFADQLAALERAQGAGFASQLSAIERTQGQAATLTNRLNSLEQNQIASLTNRLNALQLALESFGDEGSEDPGIDILRNYVENLEAQIAGFGNDEIEKLTDEILTLTAAVSGITPRIDSLERRPPRADPPPLRTLDLIHSALILAIIALAIVFAASGRLKKPLMQKSAEAPSRARVPGAPKEGASGAAKGALGFGLKKAEAEKGKPAEKGRAAAPAISAREKNAVADPFGRKDAPAVSAARGDASRDSVNDLFVNREKRNERLRASTGDIFLDISQESLMGGDRGMNNAITFVDGGRNTALFVLVDKMQLYPNFYRYNEKTPFPAKSEEEDQAFRIFGFNRRSDLQREYINTCVPATVSYDGAKKTYKFIYKGRVKFKGGETY